MIESTVTGLKMLGLTILHEMFVTDPQCYFIWLWSLFFRPRTWGLIGLTRTLCSMHGEKS